MDLPVNVLGPYTGQDLYSVLISIHDKDRHLFHPDSSPLCWTSLSLTKAELGLGPRPPGLQLLSKSNRFYWSPTVLTLRLQWRVWQDFSSILELSLQIITLLIKYTFKLNLALRRILDHEITKQKTLALSGRLGSVNPRGDMWARIWKRSTS